jgi:hypothetical protein
MGRGQSNDELKGSKKTKVPVDESNFDLSSSAYAFSNIQGGKLEPS